MRKTILFDTNIFDFLFEHKLDLSVHLPENSYQLAVIEPVEQELDRLKELKKPEKQALYSFITLQRYLENIKTIGAFAFNTHGRGIGEGYWISTEHKRLSDALLEEALRKNKEPKLADCELAAWARDHIVLTLDGDKGPMKRYRNRNIVLLTRFDPQKQLLCDFITQYQEDYDRASI